MSPKKCGAKLEGNYLLPQNYLATLGAKWEHDDVGAWTQSDAPGGISALRQKSETLCYRGELRKTISDTVDRRGFAERIAHERRVLLAPADRRHLTLPSSTRVRIARSRRAACPPTVCVFSPTAQIPFTHEGQRDAENPLERELGARGPAFRAGVL